MARRRLSSRASWAVAGRRRLVRAGMGQVKGIVKIEEFRLDLDGVGVI